MSPLFVCLGLRRCSFVRRLGHRATSSRRTSPVAVLSALQRTTSGSIPAAELLEVLSGIGLGLGNGCVLSNLTL